MGCDFPMLLDGQGADIPWIKRLRERTGCSLKDAKQAMDMMLENQKTRKSDTP
jgi:ribosomal protein L7/L12